MREALTQICESEFQNFEKRKRARFINSLSGFKSANLVGTKGQTGTNLSIVSSAVHLGADPALLGMVFRPDTVTRDTLQNIRETHFCTLNHVNADILERAHQTSARFDPEVSEFEKCQLTEEYLSDFSAPFVKESKIKLTLEFLREIKIEENGTHFLIFQIRDVYLPKDSLRADGSVDIEKANSLTVSGLDSYHQTQCLGRLTYAKPDKWPSFIEPTS